ncbi:MAG: hypothetical protein ACFFG0_31860 [Candidatus Thorarchaeota archaeon]
MSHNKHKTRIIIPDVPLFHLNWDAGDMFMNALESCLRFLDHEVNSWWLAGISGDAFKFIYDKDDIREPMRDRVPIDTVSLASSTIGWEGKWYVDEKIERTIDRIRESLEQGYPILTSNLGNQWYHGANIITGIDEDTNELFLQIGRENLSKPYAYEKVPIPESWDGPVPGSIIWGTNPIFLFKKRVEILDEEKIIAKSISQAIEIYKIKSLSYKDHPGAQKFSTPSLKGKTTNQGLAAFVELKEEIKYSEITWPVIWSITTQGGQLSYDRSNAAIFLKAIAKKDLKYTALNEIGQLFNETVINANSLKESYWNDRLSKFRNPEELLEEIYNSHSFVYNVSSLEINLVNRFQKFLPLMDTLWGPAFILDSPKRRIYNHELINKIIKNENQCFKLLERYIK